MADDLLTPDPTEGLSIVPSDDEDDPRESLDELERQIDSPLVFGESLTTAEESLIVDTAPEVYPLGRTWLFDHLAGRFVKSHGSSTPQVVRGISTLTQWIEHALRTARGAHAIYTDDYGFESPWDVVGSNARGNALAGMQRRIEEALLFHPKIVEILDYEAARDPDDSEVLLVSFTVVLDTSETIRIESLELV